MVSHSRRPQSGQTTCYLNRTYHVLPTLLQKKLASHRQGAQNCRELGTKWKPR
jgi:hypothetical protein